VKETSGDFLADKSAELDDAVQPGRLDFQTSAVWDHVLFEHEIIAYQKITILVS